MSCGLNILDCYKPLTFNQTNCSQTRCGLSVWSLVWGGDFKVNNTIVNTSNCY